MKNDKNSIFRDARSIRFMILLTCILFTGIANARHVNVPAGVNSISVQQDSLDKIRVTFDLKDASPDTFFKEIQKQTGIYFLYNTDDLKAIGNITLTVKDESLRSVFQKLFEHTFLIYSYKNNVVTIKVREKEDRTDADRNVYGQVFNEFNEPLAGATVTIKGTYIGVSTDIEGRYKIRVRRDKEQILVIRFLGMVTHEHLVSSQERMITTVLKSDHHQIQEVVLTGYERVDKRQLGGSVVSISGEELIEPVGITIDKMMQGKLAGVQVMQNSSTPGAAPKIRIRGSSSILGNREPIWVVDGVVMTDPVKVSNADLNNFDKVNLVGNAISFLNPSDIERIDVLKDVSATAIYGVKAANGVVVVTTKKGKKGKMSVNYSTSLTVKERPSYRNLNMMNSNERIQLSQEIAERVLSYPQESPGPKVGYEGLLQDLWAKKITYDEFNQGVYELKNLNTDWFDGLLRTPLSQSHNLSVSGGTDKLTYYVSGSFSDDKGVQLNTGLSRYTINTKINSKLSDKLRLSIGLNASNSKSERTHNDIDLQSEAYYTSRALRLRNDDGSLYYYPAQNAASTTNGVTDIIYRNVLNELDHSGEEQESSTINANIQMDYDITPELKFHGQFAYSNSNVTIEEWADEQSFIVTSKRQVPYGTPIPEDAGFRSSMQNPFGGEYRLQTARSKNINARASLAYSKVFGKNYFDAQVGTEMTSSTYKGFSDNMFGYFPDRGKTFASQVPSEYTFYHSFIVDPSNIPRISDNVNNTLSFYGILRYSLNSKYVFNFNIRSDGSNKFGQDESTKFLPVWSISGRWNIARENFVKDNFGFIDDLSVKASYGFQGNVHPDQTPNMIVTQGNFNATTQQFSNTINKYPNPNLRWEKTKSYQVGTDFSFFKGFLAGAFEYYYKRGEDQIVEKAVTPTNGGNKFTINDGVIVNKGWDLSLSFNIINKKDFGWNLSVNTGRNKNTVKDSGDPDLGAWRKYLDGRIIRDGYAVNSFYSYRFAGLDQNGLPTFAGLDTEDEDGNVLLNSRLDAIKSGMVYSGKREPTLSGGLSTNLRFKRFTFSSSMVFSLGNHVRLFDLYDNDSQRLPSPRQNMSDEFVDRWQKPGDENHTNIPVVSDKELLPDGFRIGRNKWQMYNKSDLRVVPGDYLKIASISLGYSFPQEICKKMWVNSLNCSFGVNNVYTFASKKLNGQNPEQLGVMGGTRTIPPQRTYAFTLNVSF